MGRKRNPIFLSEKDEYVPDEYIGIYEIFSNPKCALPTHTPEKWCLGKTKLKELRGKTFKSVRSRFLESKASDFSRYWNSNLDAINNLGINEFFKISCFTELAQAMICFKTSIKNKTNGKKRVIISFGIKKSIYRSYYDSLEKSLETGEIPEKVNLYDRHKRRVVDIDKLPRTMIRFESEVPNQYKWVEIYKNEIFTMFEQWCKLKKKTKKQGLYEAMALLMKSQPIKEMESDLEVYSNQIDIHTTDFVQENSGSGDMLLKATVPKKIVSLSHEIITRYNSDPNNKAKTLLTTDLYVAQAINEFNKNIPLKYSDPIAYEEYLNIKKTQTYNENMLLKK